ncbi:uncharacterized protein LOC125197915 [Salvia hispanica]|uniref:uncharacterized protein LOC125197915 n=1 Tax=Salvia hispanica TaxID=49212 RepID=UPI002009C4D6|nr:uncharacterized protein LOC125197915 [Salvia hispanica]
MGTREVYEEKLRRGNLIHDPTIKPGLGTARWLWDWGLLSAIHGFNTGIPYFQNRVKGPKWLPFFIGVPPLLMYSAASAAFGGYALPKLSQLIVTSYLASSSVSHYGISLLTRHIEDNHISRVQQKQLP